MKEQLRLFWEKHDHKEAEQFLALWCRDAMHSGIKGLIRVGKTLGDYRTGLLNYFKHRITSGAVEGLINKIKTLKRQACGFRDPEYFKLRLYHLHTEVLVSRMNLKIVPPTKRHMSGLSGYHLIYVDVVY
jgi:transposase